MDFKSKNYKDLTRFIYQDLSWGPLFRKKDGDVIVGIVNHSVGLWYPVSVDAGGCTFIYNSLIIGLYLN